MNATRNGPCRRMAAALVGVLCAIAAPAGAAEEQSLNLTAGLAGWHDSNLLQYSDAQLAQFESGLNPDRFSIQSKDDLTFNPSLALTWEKGQTRGRRHSLRLRGEGEFHDRDRTADMQSASLAWRETFGGGHRFLLRGYYLPRDYLRQLRDVTTTLYERAQFSLAIGEVSWSQALRRGARLAASYQTERRVYSPPFTERTSDTYQVGLSLGFDRLPKHAVLDVQGAYRSCVADGRDFPGGVASLFPDPSYHGWWGGGSGRTEFLRRRGLRLDGDLAYRYERRDFDSDRPADLSHAGRTDGNNVVEVGLRAQFQPHWAIRGFDLLDTNHATYGPGAVLTTDPGSYHQNRAGIEITWSAEVWRQTRPDGSAEPGGN